MSAREDHLPVPPDDSGMETRIFGAPGTGKKRKTTYLASAIRSTVEARGTTNIMVASFTRAAAIELTSRNLPIPPQNVGTLHSFAYRAIDRPTLVADHLGDWNDTHPTLLLSAGRTDVDDLAASDFSGASDADKTLAEVEQLRARLVPVDRWPLHVAHFYQQWCAWKTGNGLLDFSDLIQAALDVEQAPGNPVVGVFDECQDFTPMELKLVRHWGESMESIVLAGDEDQLLYCHPPGTLVRTLDGDKAIETLTPKDRVISFDKNGGSEIRRRGYEQRLGVCQHDGRLISIETENARVDVTPGHRMVAKWKRNGWAVYLMRRGGTWRVGTTVLLREKAGGVFGPGQRARQEGADALWLLSIHDTDLEARLAEDVVCTQYGISKMVFHAPTSGALIKTPQDRLDLHHETVAKYANITGCLAAHGRELGHPLWEPNGLQRARKAIMDIRACNLIDSHMVVPIDTGGSRVEWVSFSLSSSPYQGPVYSLDVQPYEHYLANGIVVHNSFKGATPEAFLNPPLPPERIRVLPQSYRLPRAVHAVAEHWIHKITRRQEKIYAPRDADGSVTQLEGGGYNRPEHVIVPCIQAQLDTGRSVMLLAACAYMLDPIKHGLKAEGIPYWNPFRPARTDWNPLSATGKNVTSAQRLLAYLILDERLFGEQARNWTGDDVRRWSQVIRKDGVFRRGFAKALAGLGEGELGFDEVAALFVDELVLAEASEPSLAWFSQNLLPSVRERLSFPIKIAQRHGARALLDPPRLILGTIHSCKGSESQVVVLLPDLPREAMKASESGGAGRDAVIRQMYVGMTRASEDLIICTPATAMAVQPANLMRT